MDDLVGIIERAWGWAGIKPDRVVERNEFGNLLVLDDSGRYWRILPEDLACLVVADNDVDFLAMRTNPDFRIDWEMANMCKVALELLGPINPTRAYCLKLPSVIGGTYDAANIGEISLAELIEASGDLGRQISAMPDGTRICLRVTD